MPSSLPRWTRTSASIGFLPCLHRPSPHIGRVGIHTFTFEACSRFTRVTACRFAAHPKWTSFPRASAGRSPYPTVQVATELNRQLLGRNFHPLAPYTLVAHQYVVSKEKDRSPILELLPFNFYLFKLITQHITQVHSSSINFL